ncbi:Anaerobic ribonucleoside-triphosphate reductase [Salmonella enterica subsp. enterica]|nr:Anaerobic ribonucleoside-triphosphate reductase [Salmonella enterica subsp. enterica]
MSRPILYMEGACGVRLKADDDVSEIFKNGRASISLGYIGIHETINALFGGEHLYDSEQLRAKGIAIVGTSASGRGSVERRDRLRL